MSLISQWRARRAERAAHNDRDPDCRYWWGDRAGYPLLSQRCLPCNPYTADTEGSES